MRSLGSGKLLGVNGVFAFDMFGASHLPADNVVQRRRQSLCQQTNATLNQMASGVVFYYSPVFAHYLDYISGSVTYARTIPRWWYELARIPEASLLITQSVLYTGDMQADLFPAIAIFLVDPSRLVLTCSAAHRLVTIAQPHITAELSDQMRSPAALLSWWGHRVWTRGQMPVIEPIVQAQDQHWLAQLYDRWDAEEAAIAQHQYDRLPLHIRRELEDAPPRWEDEEQLRWYDAQTFLEQSIEEARIFGEREPIGVRSTESGDVVLLYSDYEISEASDLDNSEFE